MQSGPFRDLELARIALDCMASTESREDFETHWQDFLFRIERAWDGTRNRFRSRSGFSNYVAFYERLRKSDPLLRYLKQARNAETHSVSPTLAHSFKVSIQEKFGLPFTPTSVDCCFENGALVVSINTAEVGYKYDAELVPGDIEATRCKNRGKWFNPPTQHLGHRIPTRHPVVIARLGLEFYHAFHHEAFRQFDAQQIAAADV